MLIEDIDLGDYECTVFDDILDEGSDTETLEIQGQMIKLNEFIPYFDWYFVMKYRYLNIQLQTCRSS